MTNGEKFKQIFSIMQVDEGELYAFAWLPNHNAAEFCIDWWNAEYEPTTKNDLGVDCVSRDEVCRYVAEFVNHEFSTREEEELIDNIITGIERMPSVTPQEPQTFKWCTDCKEYDQEKHCCHRWSKVIRNTVEEMKQEPKTGHWIERHDDWGSGIITNKRYKCSVCHGKHIDPETGEWHEVFDYKYPFCPNCGAKMESEG